ncbi:MAG: NAD(P)-dependent oxidoreductase [Eubacteriales bacterium]|nr:NAD(P)-dependent oxidoreductase [Eubacteriales bacterium]
MHQLLITIKDFETRFPAAFQRLTASALFDIHQISSLTDLTEQEKKRLLAQTEAWFLSTERLDETLLNDMPLLSIAAKMGSGMDNINLENCAERQIRVINSKGKNTNAVAEMTLCLMLSVMRHTLPLSAAARDGNWNARCPGNEIRNKTVGLVGFGMIARRLAALLAPFEAAILSYDPQMDAVAARQLHVTPVSFDELLSASDIISVHIPGLPQNEGLFCRETFLRMKKGAFFINCSRGSLVREADLYEALRSGHLKGAACDVFSQEPLPAGNPLFTLPDFIGTPHLAGMTEESMLADSMEIANGLISHFSRR